MVLQPRSGLGGILTILLGGDAALAINAATLLISALLLQRIRVREEHAACLLAKTGLGVMGVNQVILPLLGHLPGGQDRGVAGMSPLMTARGAGALIGPPIAGYWAANRPERFRRAILLAFLAISAGYALVAGSASVWLAVAGIMLAHGAGPTIWVFTSTMRQSLTEDRFHGRVSPAGYAFLILSMTLSTWTGGVAADMGVPVRGVALAVSLLVLLPAAGWFWLALPLWTEQSTRL